MYDLRNEEEAQEYLKNVENEYTFDCYHEKNGAGCYRLAEFMANVKKEFEKSSEMFKLACDRYDHAHACFRYANNKILGKGCIKDHPESLEYYKKGCDLGFSGACHNVGLFYSEGKVDGKVDTKRAIDYLQRSCDKNQHHSCYHISAIYLRGKGDVQKDMNKAFQYAQKACDLGSIHSCVNLSMMYKNGDGTEKNRELSTKYKDMAKEMHRLATKMKESDAANFNT